MKSRFMNFRPGNLALLLVLGLAACSSNQLKNSENPEVIFNEGKRLLDNGSFIEAKEFFDEVRHRFPQSRFAALAELRSADLDFQQDNFTEAAASYGVFLDLYPTHSEAAYALYQKSLSYFNDTPTNVARDQSTAQSAASSADQLLHRYPDSEFATRARELFEKSRLRLAEKEAYVARFYERRGAKVAAFRRWEGLKRSYADLQKFKTQADAQKLYTEAVERSQILEKEIESTPKSDT